MALLRAVFWTDPLIVLSTILMGSVSVICSFFDRDGRKQYAVSRVWGKMLLAVCGIKVRVRGLEHVQPGGHYLFVGNHLSLMDTPVILASLPHPFLFLVNVRFVKMPFLGTHLRRAGHFPVDSSNTRASLKTLNDAAKRMKERGLSVLLFPEGSRSRTGELQEFKEGAAVIALKSGARVIPFVIHGTTEILPVGSALVRPGVVDFAVGPPLDTEGLTLKDREQLTNSLRARVLELQTEVTGAGLETISR